MRRASSLLCLAGLLWATGVSLVRGEDTNETTPGHTFVSPATYSTGFIQGNMNATKGCRNGSQSCNELCNVCNSLSSENITSTTMECYTIVTIKFCYEAFEVNLANISHSGQCMWNNIKSSYNNFTLCTETIADCLRIPWPNKFVEDTFVQIHAKYLRDCIMTELSDPPPSIVFALVMTPICLIPIIVVLVVLKTKNGDGTS